MRHHLMPGQLVTQDARLKAYKHLATKLAPEVSLWQLGLVAWCDLRGRNPNGHDPLPVTPEFNELYETYVRKIKEASVSHAPEEAVLKGRDLLDVVKPGPKLGELVALAYHLQIEEGIKDKEELKRRILSHLVV